MLLALYSCRFAANGLLCSSALYPVSVRLPGVCSQVEWMRSCVRPQGRAPGLGEGLGHDVLDLGVVEHDRLLVLVGPLQGLQDGLLVAAAVEVEPGERLDEPGGVGEAPRLQEPPQPLDRILAEGGDGLDEHPAVGPRALVAHEAAEDEPGEQAQGLGQVAVAQLPPVAAPVEVEQQRERRRAVELPEALQRGLDLGARVGPLAQEGRVPPRRLLQLGRDLLRVELGRLEVPLERLERLAGRDVPPAPHQVVAEERREGHLVDVPPVVLEVPLDRLPEGLVELVLVADRHLHEGEVADQVGLAQGDAGGVEALEDVERVLALQLGVDELQPPGEQVEEGPQARLGPGAGDRGQPAREVPHGAAQAALRRAAGPARQATYWSRSRSLGKSR